MLGRCLHRGPRCSVHTAAPAAAARRHPGRQGLAEGRLPPRLVDLVGTRLRLHQLLDVPKRPCRQSLRMLHAAETQPRLARRAHQLGTEHSRHDRDERGRKTSASQHPHFGRPIAARSPIAPLNSGIQHVAGMRSVAVSAGINGPRAAGLASGATPHVSAGDGNSSEHNPHALAHRLRTVRSGGDCEGSSLRRGCVMMQPVSSPAVQLMGSARRWRSATRSSAGISAGGTSTFVAMKVRMPTVHPTAHPSL